MTSAPSSHPFLSASPHGPESAVPATVDGPAPPARAHRLERRSKAYNDGDYNDIPTYPIRPSFRDFQNALRPASQTVVFDGCPNDPYHPSSMPIYQTSTYVQPSADEFGPYDYTRSGNPTRTALEKHVALLESAHAAFAFTSGMAALNTLTNTLLQSGDRLLVGADIYGGMHRLCSKVTSKMGVEVGFVDTTDFAQVEAALQAKPHTRLVHIESPSNPLMRITDLRGLAKLLHKHGVLLSVDNTMMSPCLLKPLSLGADVVVHSATKYFGGHADTMGGFVVVNDAKIANKVAFIQNAEGTALAPLDCWLFLRGIKTMAIRVERAQQNAGRVAALLQRHVLVKRVFYAGLDDHRAAGYAASGTADEEAAAASRTRAAFELHRSQAVGAGAVISFTTGSVAVSTRLCDSLRIFKTTVSFGSCNSLCEMPCTMSHASIDKEKRTLPDDLVRLSVGIEDWDDLREDLEQVRGHQCYLLTGTQLLTGCRPNCSSRPSRWQSRPWPTSARTTEASSPKRAARAARLRARRRRRACSSRSRRTRSGKS